ncbi:MAG TPA: tyrosine-type recombinase/integrase [Blastocatellia bacterium]|nr:tyrosine-type recombinase/integrase [Blastocatellia bacterium]
MSEREEQILSIQKKDADSQRFDLKMATPFYQKSLSEHTRRAYRRVIAEFFHFVGGLHPAEVKPEDVLAWRDYLRTKKKRAATIAFALSVIRSFFEYLRAVGMITLNPASTRLVTPPEVPSEPAGRALTSKEVYSVLAGPDRSKAEGARDYALLLLMLRLGMRVSEVCSLRKSSIRWSHGRWVVKFKVKGGRERTLPLPAEVKAAIDAYHKLDAARRSKLQCDGPEAFLFQPHTNYRTLVFDKGLSERAVWNIVSRWASYGGVGKLSPHDLRRTAITRALDQGLTYRQVQMMSGHKDPKTIMRYDHGRENLDMNAVNFLKYEDERSSPED